MKLIKKLQSHPKTIITLIIIMAMTYCMLRFNWDIRLITLITLFVTYTTNLIAGIASLISLIPIIGPLIVKIFSIPLLWFVNSLGYISSIYAIKRGYGKEIILHRIVIIMFIIGIVLGYILGHLIPVR